MAPRSDASVTAVSRSARHGPLKDREDAIRLVEGLGVEGDAHAGATIMHRSRRRRNPDEPNLRQVHLIHAELHEELRERGFEVEAGQMGENVTTRGVDLLGLPAGARLLLGDEAVVEVTGLRTPCKQLEKVQPGLMEATLGRAPDGSLVRKAGVMGIVAAGGAVRPGDRIRVELPPEPHSALEPV
ncbi:MAG TPA: MOSC domain-containing protein [Thermoleophilaceae bacterium]